MRKPIERIKDNNLSTGKKLLLTLLAVVVLLCSFIGLSLLPQLRAEAAEKEQEEEQSVSAEAASSTHDTYFGSGHINSTALTASVLADKNYTLDTGRYYLTGNIDTTQTINIKNNVDLCLNGYKLAYTGTGSSEVINIPSGSSLVVDDCTDTTSESATSYSIKANQYAVKTETDGSYTRTDKTFTYSTTEVTATITGGLITGGKNSGIINGGTLTISGGTIAGNTAKNGGGIYNTGTLSMSGGAISYNEATSTAGVYGGGGGVYNDGKDDYIGSFTLTGGTISYNKANYGGGVINVNESSFIMTGGTISNHVVLKNGGAARTYYGSSVVMSGGTIENNVAYAGAGLHNFDNVTVTISGTAKITNNTASETGGGILTYLSSDSYTCYLYIEGGEISYNNAYNGGGIINMADTIISDSSAKITHNTSVGAGGGIDNSRNLTLDYGEISYNTASGKGGGIRNEGHLTLENGEISYNTASGNGGGVYEDGGSATFIMNGGTIDNNTAGAGGGVAMEVNCTFIMNSGTISNNTASSYCGGGVYAYAYTTFTMNDGKIIDNKASKNHGGGVAITYGDTFTMNDGTIDNNESGTKGGGVSLDYLCTFILNGGNITNNTAVTHGGGIAAVSSNITFEINGGTISRNKLDLTTNSSDGGGVYSLGPMTINDCTISDNSSRWGGGLYVEYSTCTMNGGTITNNTSYGNGGGVYLQDRGKLILNDGIISYNKANDGASHGGGIWCADNTSLTMNGGVIANNTAAAGGGVAVNSATFIMNSGTIMENSANDDNGGGIVLWTSTFTMNGGSILYNTATYDTTNYGNGGGVYGGNNTKLYINDGEIAYNSAMREGGGIGAKGLSLYVNGGYVHDNTADFGGGIAIASSDISAYITGGEIYNNSATSIGGGVDLIQGVLTMTGGTIYGNYAKIAGGLRVESQNGTIFNLSGGSIINNKAANRNGGLRVEGSINISGNPVISGNTTINGVIANLQIAKDTTRLILTDYLKDDAKIGITMYDGGTGAFTTNYGKYYANGVTATDPNKFFFSDNPNYTLAIDGSGTAAEVKLVAASSGHDGVEGATALTSTDGKVTAITASGYYYLDSDIALKSTISISGSDTIVTLCLNGHAITQDSSLTANIDGITISGGATFILTDCSNADQSLTINEETVKFSGGYISGFSVGVRANASKFIMNGGTIIKNVTGISLDRVDNSGSTCIMNGGTISYNSSGGGCFVGIYADLTINDVYITHNSGGWGGAMFVCAGAKCTINGGEFSENTATSSAGAIWVSSIDSKNSYDCGTLTINGGRIINNVSEGSGGAITCLGDFTLNDGFIVGNTSSKRGGGIAATGGSFTMNGGTISNNICTTEIGGGVYLEAVDAIINGGSIINNTAETSGGGVFVGSDKSTTLTINGGTISNNIAKANGGGVLVSYNNSTLFGTLTINGGAISNNSATEKGGGICNMSTLTIYGGTISNNTATTGGGVYNKDGATFTLTATTINNVYTYCTISNNRAENGGGVYNSGTLTLSAGGILYNTATKDGGGVYNDGTSTVSGGVISYNSAWVNGGGVYNNADKTFTLDTNASCVIRYNSANYGGGMYANGTVDLNGGSIYGNSAVYGGGVYVATSGTLTQGAMSITENTASYGGGVYNDGTFAKTGGSITTNSATTGGGVYNNGTLTMTGGSITSNTATTGSGVYNKGSVTTSGTCTITGDAEDGYVVYEASGSTFVAGGKLTITSIYLDGTYITFSSDTLLDSASSIGISMAKAGKATDGYGETYTTDDTTKAPSTYFKAFDKDFNIKLSENEVVLTQHTFGTAVWTWASDYSSATASFTCKVCDTVRTSAVKVATEELANRGATVYNATTTFDGTQYSDQKTVLSENFTSGCTHSSLTAVAAKEATCTEEGNVAYWVCDNCGTKFSDEAGTTVITDVTVAKKAHEYETTVVAPTCTTGGYTLNTCSVCGTTIKSNETDANGHNYDTANIGWIWDGYTKAYAVVTCTNEGVKYTFEATMSAAGTTHTATVTLNGTDYTSTKTEPTNGHTHNYTTVVWTWSADGKTANAVFSCASGDDNSPSTSGTVVEVSRVAATCSAAGAVVYKATATYGGVTATDVKEVVLAKLSHNLTKTAAKAATCTEAGNREYWTCSLCGNRFSDAAGTTAISDANIAIAAKGHTFSSSIAWEWNGYTAAYATATCTTENAQYTYKATVTTSGSSGSYVYTASVTIGGKSYTDTKQEAAAEHVHDYTYSITWAWATDYSTATANFTCICGDTKNFSGQVVTVTSVAASCTQKGMKIYQASVEYNGVTYSDIRSVEIAQLAHNLQKVAAKAATCTEAGNKEYWYCVDCHNYFSDNGRTTMDQSATVVAALGHVYDGSTIVWTWSDKLDKASATVNCTRCNKDVVLAATVTTTDGASNATYTATVSVNGITYTDTKLGDTSAAKLAAAKEEAIEQLKLYAAENNISLSDESVKEGIEAIENADSESNVSANLNTAKSDVDNATPVTSSNAPVGEIIALVGDCIMILACAILIIVLLKKRNKK